MHMPRDSRQDFKVALDAYQTQARAWAVTCFGVEDANNLTERAHRVLEEALELAQSLGCTRADAHTLVDYVFNRPTGLVSQEAGGVMLSLSVLCGAAGVNLGWNAISELQRVIFFSETIRKKNAGKPHGSPLPAVVPRDPPDVIS